VSKPIYRAWAEVDLNALRSNLSWIRHRVGPCVRIMTVVKADAYGHGLKSIAQLLMQSGTDIFGVANLQEAASIRAVGKGWPILMLGACLPGEFERAIRDGVMITISSRDELSHLIAAAQKLQTPGRIHLKIDTGMGRLGAQPSEAKRLLEEICGRKELHLEALYSHYSSAEDDQQFTKKQREQFTSLLAELRRTFQIPMAHLNNSAGVLYEQASDFDIVRPGLLVYGIVPQGERSRETAAEIASHLHPALTFYSRLSLIKEVPAKTPLSYGQSFRTRKKTRVGTVTVGYGDGYLRSGSNKGFILLHGKRCRILGRITMDQTLVDLSEVPEAQPGDLAVLIGKQGPEQILATELATWCGTIPWEVLTTITYRVPRVYRGGTAA
jgi:alanine racemase